MPNYIGVDLSWSGKKPTGVAVIEDTHVRFSDTVITDEDIHAIIARYPRARIAIDAPLVVPNTTGRRAAEAQCQALFGKHNAGAHPANKTLLTKWSGVVRGEELLKTLMSCGWTHDPTFQSAGSVAEVYPHAASIGLFGLEKILPYKARPHRTYETRWDALEQLQELLRERVAFSPYTIRGVRGNELKKVEDILDAIFCAVIARHAHQNPEDVVVMGSVETGSITAFTTKL